MLPKVTLVLMLMMLPATIFAQDKVMQPEGAACLSAGIAQVFVGFTLPKQDPMTADAVFAELGAEINATAAELGIKDFGLQALGYNLFPASTLTTDKYDSTKPLEWRMSGNAAFNVPASHCAELIARLKAKGFQVSLNALAEKISQCTH